jgi:hypothetical protein
LRQRVKELEAQLANLSNQVKGLNAFEIEIREVIGNSNWACLQAALAGGKGEK